MSTNSTQLNINAMNGITLVTPPIHGQTYYDTNTGDCMIYTGASSNNNGWAKMGTSSNSQIQTKFHTSDGRQISIDEIADFMDTMKRRLLILTPDLAKHERFAALKEAYDQYLVLDKLMREDLDNDNI